MPASGVGGDHGGGADADDGEWVEPAYHDECRALDMRDRAAAIRFAERLGDVLEAVASTVDADEIPAQAHQLATELSGGYGRLAVDFTAVEASASPTRLMLEGEVLSDGGHRAGNIELVFDRDSDSNLAVHLEDRAMAPWAQRQIFTALVDQWQLHFRSCGVDRLEARGDGNVLAELGFNWNPPNIGKPVFDVREHAVDLVWDPSTTEAARDALNKVLDRLDPDHPNPPTPQELLALHTDDTPDLGTRLLAGIRLIGVRLLSDAADVKPTPLRSVASFRQAAASSNPRAVTPARLGVARLRPA